MFLNVFDHCKTQEMCYKVVEKDRMVLKFDPSQFKTQEISERAVYRFFYGLPYILDKYKTQQMCESVVLKDSKKLQFVPQHFKAQEMCERFLDCCPYMVGHVSN